MDSPRNCEIVLSSLSLISALKDQYQSITFKLLDWPCGEKRRENVCTEQAEDGKWGAMRHLGWLSMGCAALMVGHGPFHPFSLLSPEPSVVSFPLSLLGSLLSAVTVKAN